MYAALEKLLLKAAMGKSFEEESKKVVSFHRDDINSDLLKVRLKTLPAVIGLQSDEVNAFNDVWKLVYQL